MMLTVMVKLIQNIPPFPELTPTPEPQKASTRTPYAPTSVPQRSTSGVRDQQNVVKAVQASKQIHSDSIISDAPPVRHPPMMQLLHDQITELHNDDTSDSQVNHTSEPRFQE